MEDALVGIVALIAWLGLIALTVRGLRAFARNHGTATIRLRAAPLAALPMGVALMTWQTWWPRCAPPHVTSATVFGGITLIGLSVVLPSYFSTWRTADWSPRQLALALACIYGVAMALVIGLALTPREGNERAGARRTKATMERLSARLPLAAVEPTLDGWCRELLVEDAAGDWTMTSVGANGRLDGPAERRSGAGDDIVLRAEGFLDLRQERP